LNGQTGKTMKRRDMKRLFELLGDVLEAAPGPAPDPDALALLRAARQLEPDLDWLLAQRLIAAGAAPARLRAVPTLSALSIAGRTD
jgi:hypothetical protein